MTNIALDANIWIYLTNDTFFELWIRLNEMKNSGEIRILINEIIFKEWERNKENTLKTLISNIKIEFKCAENLSNYFSKDIKEKYLETISEYKDETKRIDKAKLRIQEIENFMKTCTMVSVTNDQKLFIAEMAINKYPPFHNNKNNFNDCLILRSICEFVKNETPYLSDLIYVSNNRQDFIDKNTGEVYPDLFEDLKYTKLKNVTQLGEALRIAPELIDDFDSWLETQLDNNAMYKLDIIRGK